MKKALCYYCNKEATMWVRVGNIETLLVCDFHERWVRQAYSYLTMIGLMIIISDELKNDEKNSEGGDKR
jgi:hypothetical protein